MFGVRVAVISRGWLPAIMGGAEKFIFNVSHGLHSRGHEVIGVTRSWPRAPKPIAEHRLVLVNALNMPWLASLTFSFMVARTVNALDPDVVLVNGYWGEASPIWIKHPTAVVIHDLGLLRRRRVNTLKHGLRLEILKQVIKRADVVIVPTAYVLKELSIGPLAESVKDKDVFVLGGEGVDTSVTPKPIINNQFDIVVVARFAPNKNQLTILKAFELVAKSISNTHLWLVGHAPRDSNRKYFEKVLKEVRKVRDKVGDRVHIVTDVPNVHYYYDLADVCVAPSTGEEGYGLAVVECMLHGKPVIASKIFNLTGVVNPERAYIVNNPEDPVEWAFKIIHVYTHPEEAKEKARRGREYALTQSWDKVTEKVEEALRIATSRRRER